MEVVSNRRGVCRDAWYAWLPLSVSLAQPLCSKYFPFRKSRKAKVQIRCSGSSLVRCYSQAISIFSSLRTSIGMLSTYKLEVVRILFSRKRNCAMDVTASEDCEIQGRQKGWCS